MVTAATIGGASVGSYGNQSVTELDSHANMAVARRDCTICPRQGLRLGPTVSLHRRCSDASKIEFMRLNYSIKMNVHRHARRASAQTGEQIIFKYYRGA
jgi:hypothetical protein